MFFVQPLSNLSWSSVSLVELCNEREGIFEMSMDTITGISAIQAAIDCGKGVLSGLQAIKETDKKLSMIEFTAKLLEHSNEDTLDK